MAKNTVYIDVVVDDKGTTKKVAMDAKKLSAALEDNAAATTKTYRAQQGLAQNTSNSTKAFAKQSQGINGFLSLYATWAANVFAVSAAFQFLKDASDVTNLIAGQEALTKTTGVAYKTLTNSIRDATDGQLSYTEASRAAAIGVASGLSATQLNKLAEGAKNASIVLGRDLTDSFNRLIRGVTKAEPELLDELGIILRLEDASKRYADALGLNAKELTSYERTQAVANEVLRQTEEKFSKIQEVIDPSAASLNRFIVSFDNLINTIKKDVTGGLRPVFDALAGNTSALLSGLTLVSYYMLKNLLPNFSKIGAEAAESADKQKVALVGIREEAAKAKVEFQQLGLSRDAAMRAQSEKGTSALSGIDTSKAKKESGISFITGGSETAKAAANAEKIIANAEAQTRAGALVTKGVLAGLNAQQVVDLKATVAQKKAIIADFEVKHTSMMVRLGMQWKVYRATAVSALSSVRASLTTFGAFLAKWGSRAMAALGWVGVLYTIGSIAYDIYKSFDPAEKSIKAANSATEKYNSTLETLNEELNSSAKVLQGDFKETISEKVVRIGNAFAGADITNRIAEFNNLNPESEGWEEAKGRIEETLTILSKFTPEIAKYAAQAKSLSKGQKISALGLPEIENQARSAAAAIQAIPEGVRKVDEELKNLAGSGKALDPTISLRRNLTALLADLESKKKSVESALSPNNSAQEASDTKTRTELEAKLSKAKVGQANAAYLLMQYTRDTTNTSKQTTEDLQNKKVAQDQLVVGIQQELTGLAGVIAARKESKDLAEKEVAAIQAQLDYYKGLNTAISDISGELTNNAAAAAAARERAAAGQTLGITTEQKLINLGLEAEESAARRLDLVNKEKLAKAAVTANSKDPAVKRANDEALATANSELRILDSQIALEERRRAIKREELLFEKQLLQYKIDQAVESNKVIGIEQQINAVQAGAAGLVGIEAEQRILELTKLLNAANVVLAQQKVTEAQAAFDRATSLFSQGTGDQSQVVSTRATLDAAVQQRDTAQTRVTAGENAGANIVAEAVAQTQLNRARYEALSINPVEQRFQQALIDLGAKASELNATQLEELHAQIAAQEELAVNQEMRAGLFESVNANMTSALTGLIDGTKSLKTAFADMAVGILRDLAAMIAKALIFKAVSSAFGFGFANGGVAPGGFEAFANGGMAEGGFRAFASGGMVNTPTLGLVGEGKYNEAIVPLPDGRSIPVQMKAPVGTGQQQNNNVVVNVSMDSTGNGKTSTSSTNSSQAEGLGKAIAAAVQKEIQNQKRAGGMLNVYGAA